VGEHLTLTELLTQLINQLKQVSSKLDLLVQQNAELLKTHQVRNETPLVPTADVMSLLKLSPSLRKTAMALYKFEKATATELAEATGRSRPVESDCANQLVRVGLVNKKRDGMAVYFSIEPREEFEK
jgi:DNA-binding MarR family transcriptional regulator